MRFGKLTSLVIVAGVLVLLLAMGVLVWPTLYRYDRMSASDLDALVRINRATGKTEALYPSGWKVLGERNRQSGQDEKGLMPSEIAALTGVIRRATWFCSAPMHLPRLWGAHSDHQSIWET